MPPTSPKPTKSPTTVSKSPPDSPKSQDSTLSTETFKIKSPTPLQKKQQGVESFKSSLAESGLKLPSNAPPIVVNAMKHQQQQQEMKEKAIKEEAAANDDFKKFSTLYERIDTTLSTKIPSTVTQTVEELKGYFSDLDPKFKYDTMVFRKEGSKNPHTQCIKDTIKRIRDMISGMSAFYGIMIPVVRVFEYDYSDLEKEKEIAGTFENSDENAHVDMQISEAKKYTDDESKQVAFDIEREEIQTKNIAKAASVIDSYTINKLHLQRTCPALTSVLMNRLCQDTTPQGKFMRKSALQLKKDISDRVKAGAINIPLLQVTLYKEFMDAITDYRRIPKNLSRYRLIELLFVRIQRNIRDFCSLTSEWSPGLCPGDYATYMHSHHHYFNFFRMIYDVAKKLQNSSYIEKTHQIIPFLCRSVFILLTDEEVKRVVQFISELLTYDNDISLSTDIKVKTEKTKFYVRKVEDLLSKGLLTSIGGDLIKNIFFRRLICYSPIYVWVQTLFFGEVVLSKDEIYAPEPSSQSSDSYDSSQECPREPQGGGITKKRGHTNKSKKNIKNKKSGRNKKVRVSKKSRRNKKRS